MMYVYNCIHMFVFVYIYTQVTVFEDNLNVLLEHSLRPSNTEHDDISFIDPLQVLNFFFKYTYN